MFNWFKKKDKVADDVKRRWLSELATIFNKYGPESKEALDFLETAPDAESKELGAFSLRLKEGFIKYGHRN